MVIEKASRKRRPSMGIYPVVPREASRRRMSSDIFSCRTGSMVCPSMCISARLLAGFLYCFLDLLRGRILFQGFLEKGHRLSLQAELYI